MTTTQHFNIPLPDRGDSAWLDTIRAALVHVDTILHDRHVSLSETVGVLGVTEEAIEPFTMMVNGYEWPTGVRRFKPYTLQSLVDEWMQAANDWMNARPHWPVLHPEGAYCDHRSASRGTQVTMTYGPIVRLKNSTSRTSLPYAPAMLANDGGFIPSESMETHYPIIFPRTGRATELGQLFGEYMSNVANQDIAADSDGSIEAPSGLNKVEDEMWSYLSGAAYNPGSYRSTYIDHSRFTALTAIRVDGMGHGVLRIYGVNSAGAIITEDVTVDGLSVSVPTVRADWARLTGFSFKGTDLATGTATTTALYGMVSLRVYSVGSVHPITVLQAWRPAATIIDKTGAVGDYGTEGTEMVRTFLEDYGMGIGEYGDGDVIDYDQWVSPDPRFRVSWECSDPGWLWDSSYRVDGVPMMMYALGLRDNRVSYIANVAALVGDDVLHTSLTDLMTQDLLPVPASPQPMYVVGYDRGGVQKAWACTPKLVFSTVGSTGLESSYYNWPEDWDTYSQWWLGTFDGYGISSTLFEDLVASATTRFASLGEFLDSLVAPVYDLLDKEVPWDTLIPPPLGLSARTPHSGTMLLYRYEFPTDLASITQILWANTDEITQYGKVVGAGIPVPIGRTLSTASAGDPCPVKLFHSTAADDEVYAKAIADIVVGVMLGNTTGSRLQAQVESLFAAFGVDKRTAHVVVQSIPQFIPYLMDGFGGMLYMLWNEALDPSASDNMYEMIKTFMIGAGMTHLVQLLLKNKQLRFLIVAGITVFVGYTAWQNGLGADFFDDLLNPPQQAEAREDHVRAQPPSCSYELICKGGTVYIIGNRVEDDIVYQIIISGGGDQYVVSASPAAAGMQRLDRVVLRRVLDGTTVIGYEYAVLAGTEVLSSPVRPALPSGAFDIAWIGSDEYPIIDTTGYLVPSTDTLPSVVDCVPVTMFKEIYR